MNVTTLVALALGAWDLYSQSAPSAIRLPDGSTLLPDGWIQRPDGSRYWPTPDDRSRQIALAGQRAGLSPQMIIGQISSFYSLASRAVTIATGKPLPGIDTVLNKILTAGVEAAKTAVNSIAATGAPVEAPFTWAPPFTPSIPATTPAVPTVPNPWLPGSPITPQPIYTELTPGGSLVPAAAPAAAPAAVALPGGITVAYEALAMAPQAGVAMSAVPEIGLMAAAGYFAVGALVIELVGNILMGEGPLWGNTKQGEISKELMARKQTYIAQYGNAALVEALIAAPDFHAAIVALAHAPAGTSGQVQFGVGSQYAGQTIPGSAGTIETPGWAPLIREIGDPTLLLKHPIVAALFITNLWVQIGPSGAARFDGDTTQQYQAIILSKLPNSPDYQKLRQILLNRWPIVNPRNAGALATTLRAVPDLPVDKYLRVGYAKLPVDHQYGFYNVWATPPRVDTTMTIGQAALQLAGYNPMTALPAPQNPSLIMDLTTGKMLSQPIRVDLPPGQGDPSLDPALAWDINTGTYYKILGFKLDPAYFDPAAALTPLLKHLMA